MTGCISLDLCLLFRFLLLWSSTESILVANSIVVSLTFPSSLLRFCCDWFSDCIRGGGEGGEGGGLWDTFCTPSIRPVPSLFSSRPRLREVLRLLDLTESGVVGAGGERGRNCTMLSGTFRLSSVLPSTYTSSASLRRGRRPISPEIVSDG